MGIFCAVAALGLHFAAQACTTAPPEIRQAPLLGQVFSRIWVDWLRLGVFLTAGILLLKAPARLRSIGPVGRSYGSLCLCLAGLVLAIVDLFWTSIGANPTAKPEQVYPETKGIAFLREHTGHSRIFPVNRRWSLFAAMPFILPAALPPNAATVFGLRDVQGYDSLFSGRYKAYANGFALENRFGARDASPVEVGNMVFFQNANAPNAPETAASYAVTIPYDQRGFPAAAVPPTTPLDTGDSGMMVYEMPSTSARAVLSPGAPGTAVEWQEDAPTRVTLAVTAPVDSALTLHDSAMPGWQLSIDAKPSPILTNAQNPVIRSTPIIAGSHTVAFRYEPSSLRIGLFAACAALLTVSLSVGIRIGATFGNRKVKQP